MNGPNLSPIERTITKLHAEGLALADIAARVGKKPGTVARIMEMARYRIHSTAAPGRRRSGLSPVERTVLRLRRQGETYGEIGNRLRRSSRRVREIERFASYRLGDVRP
jgi:DNA-binding CsgD family transcriptional regulator|nr:MAG: hypothetical protein DIU67_05720 [Actinomycetota bacterium]